MAGYGFITFDSQSVADNVKEIERITEVLIKFISKHLQKKDVSVPEQEEDEAPAAEAETAEA